MTFPTEFIVLLSLMAENQQVFIPLTALLSLEYISGTMSHLWLQTNTKYLVGFSGNYPNNLTIWWTLNLYNSHSIPLAEFFFKPSSLIKMWYSHLDGILQLQQFLSIILHNHALLQSFLEWWYILAYTMQIIFWALPTKYKVIGLLGNNWVYKRRVP